MKNSESQEGVLNTASEKVRLLTAAVWARAMRTGGSTFVHGAANPQVLPLLSQALGSTTAGAASGEPTAAEQPAAEAALPGFEVRIVSASRMCGCG